MAALDLTGRRYKRLVVIEWTGRSDRGNRVWLCRCDCGEMTEATTSNLRNGNTQSCGCLKREMLVMRNWTHGFRANRRYHPLYYAWQGMRQRCDNPNDDKWDRYGGRGITVCERWRGEEGFVNFVADMGDKPSPKHSLNRINNDGNYEPGNCEWATPLEQSRNRGKRRTLVGLRRENAELKARLEEYERRFGPLEEAS